LYNDNYIVHNAALYAHHSLGGGSSISSIWNSKFTLAIWFWYSI